MSNVFALKFYDRSIFMICKDARAVYSDEDTVPSVYDLFKK